MCPATRQAATSPHPAFRGIGVATLVGGRLRAGWILASAAVLALGACQGTKGDRAEPPLAETLAKLGLDTSGRPIDPQSLTTGGRVGASSPAPAQPIIVHGQEPRVGTDAPLRSLASGGAIELNFEDAGIPTVAKTILGDLLGLSYTVDPRVQGRMTLSAGRPMARAEALSVFESALRMNGAALLVNDGVYNVVPASEVRQPGNPARYADIGGAAGAVGSAFSIYAPRHGQASSLKTILEPLYPIQGMIQADPERNLLIVSGTGEERRAVIEAAQGFDQDFLAGQSVGVFPLSRATPAEVIDELGMIYAIKGNADSSIRFLPVDRMKAVLVVARRAAMLDQAGVWIRRLDQGGDGERTINVHPLQHAKAADLARVLSRLFGGGGGDGASGSPLAPNVQGARLSVDAANSATSGNSGTGNGAATSGALSTSGGTASGASSSSGSSGGQNGGLSSARTNRNASAFGAGDVGGLESGASGGGGNAPRVVAHTTSNSLVIFATPSEYRLIQAAIAKLDLVPQQVMIEATIAEVTLNDSLRYGVQYFLKGNGFANVKGSSLGFDSNNTSGLQSLLPGFNAVLGNVTDPRVVISALDSITNVKVVSSPQVVVEDNQQALLKVGDKVPVITQQVVSTTTANAPLVNAIEFRDTGVILSVTPRVNADGTVSIDVVQEVSAVSRSADTGTLTPTISQRRIESAISVRNGQTVALGGLISEDDQGGRSGVPLLSDVPVVGELFSFNDRSRKRTELIVFITPRIIRDSNDARRVTEELMGRLRSLQTTAPTPAKAGKTSGG
jgi:general secretion pathway protein D